MTQQTKITLASIVFLLVAITDVYAVITQNKTLEMVFKPLLMTTLAVVYLVSVKKPSFWLVSALFFSFWGDVFLLDKTNFFVFGLASFLVAHLLYIKITISFLYKDTAVKTVISAIPFVLLFVGLLGVIYSNLGDMLLPVLVYGVTISTFGTAALLNYCQQKSTANLWLLLGALLFIASDSLIALNNFHTPKPLYDIAIIVLYIVSQYLIVRAVIAKTDSTTAN
ncbi:lysoplasmalogenase [Tenacibaculum tangerinum]|uniref:Lysoplasmalogenase n=1 Tax=Tenacibaculum tangerinum TaxID=3038772 RepID=A0ABY8L6G7_9FLAO|nr:lysoplasmalogenase [Tenacibaculum tangerinum]WGH75795.1 lysoplasmalogenase [Tenacibaculum tangerinum]